MQTFICEALHSLGQLNRDVCGPRATCVILAIFAHKSSDLVTLRILLSLWLGPLYISVPQLHE